MYAKKYFWGNFYLGILYYTFLLIIYMYIYTYIYNLLLIDKLETDLKSITVQVLDQAVAQKAFKSGNHLF
jgi:hypothetical protein